MDYEVKQHTWFPLYNNGKNITSLDQGMSFKHYYIKKLARKTVSMTDHKLLHDVTHEGNVSHAQYFITESWHCVAHMTIANCFQICGFKLNQTSHGEDVTELCIAEDDWG
jgi:hypothetical protein